MKINFVLPVLNLDNIPMKDENGRDLVFSRILGNSIFQSQDKNNQLESYELAKKIYNSTGEIELSTSEIEKIKERAKESFLNGFAGQLLELISDAQNAKTQTTLEDPKPIGGGGGAGGPRPPKEE